MRLFFQDIRRGLSMWTFWMGVIIILLISYFKYLDGFESQHFVVMLENYGFIGTLNRVVEALCNGNIGIPTVIAAVIAYGTTTCREMKSGYISNELTRIRPSKFLLIRVFSTATIGALIMIFVYIIWFIYAYIVDPNPSTQIVTYYGPIGTVYEKSIWGYIMLFALQSVLLTAFYSLFAMGASIVWRNQYLGYTVPLIYFLSREILIRLLGDEFVFIYAEYPFDLITPIFQSISATLFVLPLSLLLIGIGYRQWRSGNW